MRAHTHHHHPPPLPSTRQRHLQAHRQAGKGGHGGQSLLPSGYVGSGSATCKPLAAPVSCDAATAAAAPVSVSAAGPPASAAHTRPAVRAAFACTFALAFARAFVLACDFSRAAAASAASAALVSPAASSSNKRGHAVVNRGRFVRRRAQAPCRAAARGLPRAWAWWRGRGLGADGCLPARRGGRGRRHAAVCTAGAGGRELPACCCGPGVCREAGCGRGCAAVFLAGAKAVGRGAFGVPKCVLPLPHQAHHACSGAAFASDAVWVPRATKAFAAAAATLVARFLRQATDPLTPGFLSVPMRARELNRWPRSST